MRVTYKYLPYCHKHYSIRFTAEDKTMMLIILFGFISFGKLFCYIVAKIGHNLIFKRASIQSPKFLAMLSVNYQIHDDNSKRITIQIKN